MPETQHPGQLLVVLGNQLFVIEHLPPSTEVQIFMAEDRGLCTYVRHHKQKIALFLSAMRSYADELRKVGYSVHYHQLNDEHSDSYESRLALTIEENGLDSIQCFEIEDKPMESRIREFVEAHDVPLTVLPSPMFLCDREHFAEFVSDNSRLMMADFYKAERKRQNILIKVDGSPVGDKWSFDEENRKKLPKNVEPPSIEWSTATRHTNDVIAIVKDEFSDHPGSTDDFGWPTTRYQARAWLKDFITNRLDRFGPYEDAITTRSPTLFHSALTPMMNLGLLTPKEVIDTVLEQKETVLLSSVEGFVRQIIGWREFIRGIYQNFSEEQEQRNFWQHTRRLTDDWYEGTTGIPPLDDTIDTAQRLGWSHHITRLMIMGNMMTLCEIDPVDAHRWFMEMYVDSSEWVMGPNVYGMALFSDGGIFATKPYICGSNYLLKMSDYKKGPWCDVVDGLYWRFIDKHREYFSGNPRLALMPSALDRLKPERRKRIFSAAEEFLAVKTVAP